MKLNKKGQISLDLIFSLLIVVIFISTMLWFVEDYRISKENVSLENNLKKQSILTANFITNANLMQDTTFEAMLLVNKINYNGELISPEIEITPNSITFKYNEKSATSFFSENSEIEVKQVEDYIVVSK